jgi:hypothetical protein
MIVVKADKYWVCDWLRKLDLNQRPTGYEFATKKDLFFSKKHLTSRYLKALSSFNNLITLSKYLPKTTYFCQSVKRLTKINCTKTAHFKKTINTILVNFQNYNQTILNTIYKFVSKLVLMSQKLLSHSTNHI